MSDKERTTPVPAVGTSKRLLLAKAEIDEINNEKVILQNKVSELEKDLSECKQKYHNTYNELVLRKDDIKLLKFELDELVSQIVTLKRDKDKVEEESKILKIQNDYLQDLKNKYEENAPTCKNQTVVALKHDVKILQSRLEDSETLRESLQTQLTTTQEYDCEREQQIIDLKKELATFVSVNQELDKWKNFYKEAYDKLEESEQKRANLDLVIKSYKESQERDIESYKKLNSELAEVNEKFRVSNNNYNSQKSRNESLSEELSIARKRNKELEDDRVRLSNLCLDLEKRLVEADSNLSEAEKARIRLLNNQKEYFNDFIKTPIAVDRSASSKDRIEMTVNDRVKVSIEMESHLVVINSYVGGCIMTLNLPNTWAVSRVLQHVYSILESDIK